MKTLEELLDRYSLFEECSYGDCLGYKRFIIVDNNTDESIHCFQGHTESSQQYFENYIMEKFSRNVYED